jgi:hypothetical protein
LRRASAISGDSARLTRIGRRRPSSSVTRASPEFRVLRLKRRGGLGKAEGRAPAPPVLVQQALAAPPCPAGVIA